MAPRPGRSFEAVPNVLRDQTTPNTLGGVGPPRPASRARPSSLPAVPIRAVIAAIVVLVVVVLLMRM